MMQTIAMGQLFQTDEEQDYRRWVVAGTVRTHRTSDAANSQPRYSGFPRGLLSST